MARVVGGPAGVSEAARLLAQGSLVALPTETVYGLAARALDPQACAAIFEVKERPLTDPLIVHLPDLSWLALITEAGSLATGLAEAFWPGPLTLVLPKKNNVPDIVTAGESTVAVRISSGPLMQAVLKELGEPVAAPSANRFGRISPTEAAHVVEELGDRIPLILNGGPCLHGIESTILLVREETIRILRQGPVTRQHLEPFASITEDGPAVAAPGTMKSHYAPRTPMALASDFPAIPSGPRCGLLAWASPGDGFASVERLSATLNLREAAATLYAAMRRLDALKLDAIVAELPPPEGLGLAIRERLIKACAAT